MPTDEAALAEVRRENERYAAERPMRGPDESYIATSFSGSRKRAMGEAK